jgi:hypothetical protein
MEFLKYFSIRYSYYIYTVLRSVLMLRSGLEFEREYSAVIEGYRYVYYFSYKGINQKKIFNSSVLYVAWSWMVFSQRCRILYFTRMYFI